MVSPVAALVATRVGPALKIRRGSRPACTGQPPVFSRFTSQQHSNSPGTHAHRAISSPFFILLCTQPGKGVYHYKIDAKSFKATPYGDMAGDLEEVSASSMFDLEKALVAAS